MRFRLLFLVLVLFCSSCSNKKEQNEDRTVFRYNEYSNISSLDPAFSKNQAHIWAVNQLFNGLVKLDKDLNIQPDIADSWQIKNEGLDYIFKIKEGVFFHDHELFDGGKGRMVNAKDVAYSLERLKSAELAAPGAWVVKGIKRVEVLSAMELKITLTQPNPAFLSLLTMKYCSVVPKEIVEYYGSNFGRNPIGTGPFYFKVWQENVKLVLRKNPSYFEKDIRGGSLPYLDAVAINFLADKQAEFMALLQGELDMLSGLDPAYKDEILDQNGNLSTRYVSDYSLLKGAYLNTEYLGLNFENEIFSKHKELREALNIGFDRVQMMKYLRNNVGSPALQGFVPKGLPTFDSEIKYDYDPKRASEIVSNLKKQNPETNFKFSIATNSQYLDLCEFVQRQWQDIGLDVSVEVLAPATLKQSKATNRLDVFRASWIADYPDAENYLALFLKGNFSPSGPNYTHFTSEDYEILFSKAFASTNTTSRFEYYKDLNDILLKEIPVIPLYYDEVIRLIPNRVKGMEINGVNTLDLRKVQIAKE